MTRVFNAMECSRPNPAGVERTVVHQTPQAALVVWHLLPGQDIALHAHPAGQDTWVVIAGEADYLLDRDQTRRIRAGDVAVAQVGQLHGARNRSDAPFVFASVVTPAEAGYELAD
jgi:quercetin dioxygenase-like cupin family protein